ncbi:MAG: GMC oxidoreductase [Gaiellaceae bacterium]
MPLEDVPQKLRADVCVVGAGAAGLALAHALRDAGVSIVVLESGPIEDSTVLDAGEVVGHTYNGLTHGRVRGPGGTTSIWPGQCMRFRPEDYEAWPFGPDEMEPHWARAERMLGLTPGELARDPWESLGEPGPGFDPARVESASAIFVGRRNLADLDVGAATLLTGAIATRVESGRVEVRDLAGRAVEVEAAIIVLAAGGIETPRILLASGIGGNEVGRGFQDHPFCEAATVAGRPRPLQDMYGMRLRRPLRYYPKLLLSQALRPRGEPGCMANVVFRYGSRSPLEAALRARRRIRAHKAPAVRDLALVAGGLPELAAGAVRAARGREPAPRPERIRLLTIVEQVARPDSRLTLGDELDPLGVPRARIEWRLGEEERLAIDTFVAVLDEELRRTSTASLEREPWLDDDDWADHLSDGFHPAGGARFGAVVDRDCAVLGVHGVYVCGSSVFPRSGCANPTLMILALAFRLADHLRNR